MAPRVETGLDVASERQVATALFNKAWELLELPERTRAQDDELLHCAHASAYHWRKVGTTIHFSRSEWQCSRVYAVLDRAEPSLWHARRALDYCEQAGDAAEPFDLPFCYEGLARAHAVAGQWEASRTWLERAREQAASIEDDEDRELVLAALATIPHAPRP